MRWGKAGFCMRVALAAFAMLIVGSGTPRAQPADSGAGSIAPDGRQATHLHISADGSVSVPPDELVADLVAQASSPSAAAAQQRVNTLMAKGMKTAKATSGVEAKAIGYSVQKVEAEPVPVGRPPAQREVWSAQQTLELRGHDGESLLDLVGKLQEEGFATSSLDWRLSPDADRKARDAAMIEALRGRREISESG